MTEQHITRTMVSVAREEAVGRGCDHVAASHRAEPMLGFKRFEGGGRDDSGH
jgi:hypothetical protein